VTGTRGRALTAVALTLRDVRDDAHTQFVERGPDLARGGGLRGGHYRIDQHNALHLTRVEFVPRLRLSGSIDHFAGGHQRGRLRLSGRLGGSLTLRGRRVSGRLAGQRVAARLPSPSAR
jgi:hypothetical protein